MSNSKPRNMIFSSGSMPEKKLFSEITGLKFEGKNLKYKLDKHY